MTNPEKPQGIESYTAQLTHTAQQVSSGFLPLRKEAKRFTQAHTPATCITVANTLLDSEIHQVRALATFILGYLAAKSGEAMAMLQNRVAQDKDWRVQEILAKAFDQYCADRGYQQALPVIQAWLAHNNPNMRRAVTEGLRIWTGRPYFKQHPEEAVKILSQHKDDPSEYVRRSVGNALKDISKKHPQLVQAETDRWEMRDKKIRYTYKFASKYLPVVRKQEK